MKLPLFCIIVLIFTCCKNKSETSDLELKNNLIPNTKVVVHFVNKNDTMKIGFESKILQYQHFALEDFPIMNIPKIKTSKNENVETWSFYLEVPQIINLGYNTFYVEPNDSIDITYENIGIDKFKSPIEKIVFNTPNSFIFWHNNLELTFSNINDLQPLTQLNSESKITDYFSINYIDSLSNVFTNNVFKNNKKFIENKIRRHSIFKIMVQFNFNYLSSLFKERISYFTEPKKSVAINQLVNLHKVIADRIQEPERAYQFYSATTNIFDLFFESQWKKVKFNFDTISERVKAYDKTLQQYLFLLVLKKDIIDLRNDTLNLNKIKSAITNRELEKYAEKYLTEKTNISINSNFLSEEVKNILVFDYNLNATTLGEILNKTQQPRLYFDFCGSWCNPCLKEIDEYASSKRNQDNSTSLKPVWIFFENNKRNWLKMIGKYRLNKESCYLVLDNKLQIIISSQLNWAGEFPHHFILTNKGEILEKNAPSLSKYNP